MEEVDIYPVNGTAPAGDGLDHVVPGVRVLAALAEAVYQIRDDDFSLPPNPLLAGWECVQVGGFCRVSDCLRHTSYKLLDPQVRAIGRAEWNFTAAAFHSVSHAYPCVVIAFRYGG